MNSMYIAPSDVIDQITGSMPTRFVSRVFISFPPYNSVQEMVLSSTNSSPVLSKEFHDNSAFDNKTLEIFVAKNSGNSTSKVQNRSRA